MGNAKLRRLLIQETSYTDTQSRKHRHEYTVESLVCIHYKDCTGYYHVMKCKHCNSFKSISKPNNESGLVINLKNYSRLPIYHLETTRNFTIGFTGLGLKPHK